MITRLATLPPSAPNPRQLRRQEWLRHQQRQQPQQQQEQQQQHDRPVWAMMVATAPGGEPPRLRGKPCDSVTSADGRPLLRGGFVAERAVGGRPTPRVATSADFCAPVASPKQGSKSMGGGFAMLSQHAAVLNDDDNHIIKNVNDNDNNNDRMTTAKYIGKSHVHCRTRCCLTSNTASVSKTLANNGATPTPTARRGESPMK